MGKWEKGIGKMGKEESLNKGKECAKALWQLGQSTYMELQKYV